MVSSQVVKDVLGKYVELVGKKDVEAILALYAEDAVVEDPVGGDAQVGFDAIVAFYRHGLGGAENVSSELIAPVRTTGVGEGAMAFTVTMTMDGQAMKLHAIDVMKLNDAGKIVSMKAYWSFEHNVEML